MSNDLEWIPVAVVTMVGEGNPLYVNAVDDWQSVHDEVLGGWFPPSDTTHAVDPATVAPPFAIVFTAMTRAEFDALPEHSGW